MAGVDYAAIGVEVAAAFAEVKQGIITLTRSVPGTPINNWTPGTPTTTTYELDAITKAVEDKFIDGTTIFATDTQIKTGAQMTRTHVNGVAAAALVVETSIAPGDVIAIDGQAVTVVREMRFPKAGDLVMWTMIVRG